MTIFLSKCTVTVSQNIIEANNNIIFIENSYFLSACLQLGDPRNMPHLGFHLYLYVLILISRIYFQPFITYLSHYLANMGHEVPEIKMPLVPRWV